MSRLSATGPWPPRVVRAPGRFAGVRGVTSQSWHLAWGRGSQTANPCWSCANRFVHPRVMVHGLFVPVHGLPTLTDGNSRKAYRGEAWIGGLMALALMRHWRDEFWIVGLVDKWIGGLSSLGQRSRRWFGLRRRGGRLVGPGA